MRDVTIRYHEELLPVVISLFDNLRTRYEKRGSSGSHIPPGTVLRCDGIDQSNTERPDFSVLFTSFPYFDVSAGKPHGTPKDHESTLLSRGLFQNAYPREPTQDRDGDQVFQHMRQEWFKDYLSVDQLWSLVIASTTLVTCGPSSLFGLFDGDIDFVDEGKLRAHGRSLLHVTDPFGGITYLPLNQCKNWLEARQTIEEKCLANSNLTLNDCNMHSGEDDEILEVGQWPDLLKSDGFIYIRLKQKSQGIPEPESTPLPTKEKLAATKAPDKTLLIEYAELSSDEEVTHEKEDAHGHRSETQ